jgi:enoyl-CoA hydratase
VTLVVKQLHGNEISLLRLNDPGRYNALSGAMISQLIDAISEVGRDPSTRAVVLYGEGRGFCAGADLSKGGANEPAPGSEHRGKLGALLEFQDYLAALILSMRDCPKPVVGAVHGAAVGGGLALALACDIRVCSAQARFGSRPIRMGLSSCELGSTYQLPRMVGMARADELLLTGRDFDAAEAEQIGLVSEVVPEAYLLDRAIAVAESIAVHSEYAVATTKAGLAAGLDAVSLRHAFQLETRIQVLGMFTGNLEEAARAFFERRQPIWKPL